MAWQHLERAYADLPPDRLTRRELDTAARLERAVWEAYARGPDPADSYPGDPMYQEREFLRATGQGPGTWPDYSTH